MRLRRSRATSAGLAPPLRLSRALIVDSFFQHYSLPRPQNKGGEMRSIRRPLVLAGSILSLALLAPLTHVLAANGPGSRPAPPTCPSFDAGNFHKSTTINNRYFPLVPGTRFTYKGNAGKASVVDIVTVTH